MARYKHPAKKKKLARMNKLTKWAPFWLIPKVFGKGKRVHPIRITRQKRSWRRTKLKI
ncbi:MAG: large subunit ribosomal protein L39e [Candidatus Woesearchaeota archaeon]|nr:large subunit ribosomal protein L39e [Candidatus Woesearchaeota archaeon]MDN5327372.1 large subunit ribosomal protein L39e [Candidatus Woesearchaeota archaeon]